MNMTGKQKAIRFGLVGVLLLIALRVLEYFVSPTVIWPISSIVVICVLAYVIQIRRSKEKWEQPNPKKPTNSARSSLRRGQ